MKKTFLILAISMLLIGCDSDVNTVEAEKKTVLKLEKVKESYFNELSTFIIKDTETDQEYIVVKNVSEGGGVAITPRLK